MKIIQCSGDAYFGFGFLRFQRGLGNYLASGFGAAFILNFVHARKSSFAEETYAQKLGVAMPVDDDYWR